MGIYTPMQRSMPRRKGGPKRPGILLELTNEQLRDLDALSEAYFGTARVRLIRQAIREFIERQVNADSGLRQRFEDARVRGASSSHVLRLVSPDPTRK
jgi:hypothetical protein